MLHPVEYKIAFSFSALEDAETEAFLSSKKMVPPGGKSECNGEATPVLGTDALDGSPGKDAPHPINCGKDSDEKKVQNNRKLLFGVEETPDVYWSVLLAFQVTFISIIFN